MHPFYSGGASHKAYWSGLDEPTGTVRYIDYPVDPPGLTPADLTLLEYENIPYGYLPYRRKVSKMPHLVHC